MKLIQTTVIPGDGLGYILLIAVASSLRMTIDFMLALLPLFLTSPECQEIIIGGM